MGLISSLLQFKTSVQTRTGLLGIDLKQSFRTSNENYPLERPSCSYRKLSQFFFYFNVRLRISPSYFQLLISLFSTPFPYRIMNLQTRTFHQISAEPFKVLLLGSFLGDVLDTLKGC